MTRPAPVTTRYRLAVAGRIAAAVGGGYAIATLAAIAVACLVPMAPAEAAMVGTLLALLLWPVVAMACVWARSAARAWGGVAIAAALLAGLALAGGWRP